VNSTASEEFSHPEQKRGAVVSIPATTSGGVHHGLTALSHAERAAALNALSKINNPSGRLGSTLGGLKQSATLIGGATKHSASTLLHGAGHDTFIGGARTTTASVGNDTVLSGSARIADRGVAGAEIAGRHAGHSGLSSDTINVAGTTAASVKAVQPEDKAKAHTVTLGDKTKVTISGLSTHDISKLHH
jgi:hypothetical protein